MEETICFDLCRIKHYGCLKTTTSFKMYQDLLSKIYKDLKRKYKYFKSKQHE